MNARSWLLAILAVAAASWGAVERGRAHAALERAAKVEADAAAGNAVMATLAKMHQTCAQNDSYLYAIFVTQNRFRCMSRKPLPENSSARS